MNKAGMFLVAVMLFGCAQKALVKEWKDTRGYSDEEIKLITPHAENYIKMMSTASSFGGSFMTATNTANSEQRLRSIVCNCLKKLKGQCRKRPEGLQGDELELWAKSNGAEYALKGAHNDANLMYSDASGVDSAECP